jgi:aspartate aminotransferase-like enzyme
MSEVLLMTPGPTYVHEEVRNAMSRPITNPDIDPAFYELYKDTCEGFKSLMKTKNDVLILGGEGILGLEASCASLIEPGDRVLCIDNGIFGKGFGDFQKMYGAEVVYFTGDYQKPIDLDELEAFLYADCKFKMATVVHCETPSGVTNPIDKICPLLKKHGIITVVDSVSGIGGENIEVDNWKIDIALGGSQKCLSAPPGLTFLSISSDAYKAMENRKTPIAGFYCNLLAYKGWYEGKWFPYTQAISDIYALKCALDRLLEQNDYIERHQKISEAVRKSIEISGLSIYAKGGYSTTVTAVEIPKGITFEEIYNEMLEKHNIMIGGAFDYLKGKIFRIGHMGENCHEEKLFMTLKALTKVLENHNIKLNGEIHKHFVINMK